MSVAKVNKNKAKQTSKTLKGMGSLACQVTSGGNCACHRKKYLINREQKSKVWTEL